MLRGIQLFRLYLFVDIFLLLFILSSASYKVKKLGDGPDSVPADVDHAPTATLLEVSTAVRAVKSSGKGPSVEGLEDAKQAVTLFAAKCDLNDERTECENKVCTWFCCHPIISIVPL